MRIYTEPKMKIFEFDTEEILTASTLAPTPTTLIDNEEGDFDTGGSIVIPKGGSIYN